MNRSVNRRITIDLTPDDYNFLAQDYTGEIDSRYRVGKFVSEAVKKAIEEQYAAKGENNKKASVSIVAIN
jgi:hypothetical protein